MPNDRSGGRERTLPGGERRAEARRHHRHRHGREERKHDEGCHGERGRGDRGEEEHADAGAAAHPVDEPDPERGERVPDSWWPCSWRWRWRTSRRTARKTISAATAVSAPRWTRSGRYASKSRIGTPKTTSVSACPSPHQAPSAAARRRAFSRPEAISVVTAARWSGSVACRRPSRVATRSDDQDRAAVRERRDVVVESEHG